MERKIENIPQGFYCYDDSGTCPYWSLQPNMPHQENGYCHFLQKGDGTFDGLSHLWDQVKECNMFREINEYEYSIKSNFQSLLKRISLFGTISKAYSILERISIMFSGKICRCKFCKQYFIQPNGATNLTQCARCFFKMIKRRKEKENNSNE